MLIDRIADYGATALLNDVRQLFCQDLLVLWMQLIVQDVGIRSDMLTLGHRTNASGLVLGG
jgi:hypothetical protein